MVERPRQRDGPAKADPAECRLQPHDPAERGGDPDRSAGVAADGAEAESADKRRAIPAARPTGDAIGGPGVPRGTEVRVVGRNPERPPVQVRLPEIDRAGGEQPTRDLALLSRDVAREKLRARGRENTGDIE